MARWKFSIFDGRKIGAFIRQTNEIADKLLSDMEKLIIYYDAKYLYNGDLVIEHVVDMFYEDYTPHIYKRKEDLYNAYRVYIENGNWGYDFGSDLMLYQHHQSNEYIYENSFVGGYHGGDDNGKDHPEPGVPWWKAPPSLKYWYKPASRWSSSPYFMAKREIEKLIDDMSHEKYQDGHEKIVNAYNKWYKSLLDVFRI